MIKYLRIENGEIKAIEWGVEKTNEHIEVKFNIKDELINEINSQDGTKIYRLEKNKILIEDVVTAPPLDIESLIEVIIELDERLNLLEGGE